MSAATAQAAVASINLSPNSGPAGMTVKVTGTGFPKKTSGTVKAGTASAAFTASASGFFAVDLVIPETGGPVVSVQAAAATTRTAASFTFTSSSPAEPVPAPAPNTAPLRFGVGTAGGPLAAGELDEVSGLVNEAPSIILSYKDFHQPPPLAELDAARARGAEVLLTWEPWTWGGGTAQPAYSLDRITAGDFDPYLRQWGQALAGWGHPVMLRFGHEMNGSWYP
ncbi:MAG: beta-mannanase, partial [Arthrobacter sp.]